MKIDTLSSTQKELSAVMNVILAPGMGGCTALGCVVCVCVGGGTQGRSPGKRTLESLAPGVLPVTSSHPLAGVAHPVEPGKPALRLQSHLPPRCPHTGTLAALLRVALGKLVPSCLRSLSWTTPAMAASWSGAEVCGHSHCEAFQARFRHLH